MTIYMVPVYHLEFVDTLALLISLNCIMLYFVVGYHICLRWVFSVEQLIREINHDTPTL
jgi:hypothetical protein